MNSLIALGAFAVAASDFGVTQAAARDLARDEPQLSGQSLREVFAIRYVTAGALVTVGFIVTVAAAPREWWLPTLLVVVSVGAESLNAALFVMPTARLQVDLVAAIQAAQRIVQLVVVVALLVGDKPLSALPAGMAASSVIVWLCLRNVYGPRGVALAPRRMWQRLVRARHFFITGVASQLQGLEVPVAAIAGGAAVAGNLASASRLTTPLSLIPSSVAFAVLPAAAAEPSRRAARLLFYRASAVTVGLMGGVLTALGLATPTLVRILLGREYAGSVAPIRIVMIGLFIASANAVIAAYLQARGYERLVSRAIAVASIAGLAATAAGAALAGADGAAAAIPFMQLLILVPLLIPVRRAQ